MQSIGGLFGIGSLIKGSVLPGPYCSLQASILTSSEVGSAIWTLVIAVNTVLLVAGGQKCKDWISKKNTSGKGRWGFSFAVWALLVFLGLVGPFLLQPMHPQKAPFCILSLASFNQFR